MRDELVADVVGFARALRAAAGLAIGIDQVARCAEALALIDPPSRHNAYLAARATLVYGASPISRSSSAELARAGSARPTTSFAVPRPMPLAPRHRPERVASAGARRVHGAAREPE